MNEMQAKIRQWLNEHREEFVSDLAELCAVRSVKAEAEPGKPFGAECARMMGVAEKMASHYGFECKNWENYVVTADCGPKDRALDILAHLDVVGEGVGWDSDPYTVRRDGDLLYGRGVADDKGPVLTALYAMRCVRDLGLPMTHGVRLIMGSDEESGSQDIQYYYSKEKPAPGTFSPDAWFPVYNTEKGMYKPVYTMSYPKSQVLPRVSRFDGGFRINVLPSDADADLLGVTVETAEAVLKTAAEDTGVAFRAEAIEGGVRIFAHGVQAHASLPENGNNGLTALIDALCRFELADCGSTEALHGLHKAFPHGDVTGAAIGIDLKDDISGRITVVFSLLHLDEEGMSGQFDSRVPICATKENCHEVCAAFLGNLGFNVNGHMIPGHHTPAEGEFVQTLLGCYEDATGRKGECCSMGGGTYVHHIEGGVAFGPGMPDFDNHEHGANEVAKLDSLITAAEVYALAITRLCR